MPIDIPIFLTRNNGQRKKQCDYIKNLQLANASTDAAQNELFTGLAPMERGHKARLEDICTNMAFPEVW